METETSDQHKKSNGKIKKKLKSQKRKRMKERGSTTNSSTFIFIERILSRVSNKQWFTVIDKMVQHKKKTFQFSFISANKLE